MKPTSKIYAFLLTFVLLLVSCGGATEPPKHEHVYSLQTSGNLACVCGQSEISAPYVAILNGNTVSSYALIGNGSNSSIGLTVNGSDVSYTNTSSKKSVVIKTSISQNLTINAPYDDITHFGEVKNVNIIAVADNSYHGKAIVEETITVAKGNIELEVSVPEVKVEATGNVSVNLAKDVKVESISLETKSGTELQTINVGGSGSVEKLETTTPVKIETKVEAVEVKSEDVSIVLSGNADVTKVKVDETVNFSSDKKFEIHIEGEAKIEGVTGVDSEALETTSEPGTTPVHIHIWNAGQITKAATCTTDGETTYLCTDKACSDKKTEVIKALGHNYGEPAWTWSSDCSTATAKFTCQNDSKHVETINATVSSTILTAVTCTTKGNTKYTATATFNGKEYNTEKNVEIVPFGHKYNAENICTECGSNKWSPYYTISNGSLIINESDVLKIQGVFSIPSNVTTIAANGIQKCSNITAIIVPASVKNVDLASFEGANLDFFYTGLFPNVSSITVADSNPVLSSIDGVLFSKDKKTLYFYPKKKSGSSYNVPESVTAIGYGAFDFCEQLTSITIQSSVIKIDETAFANCDNLSIININKPEGSVSGAPWLAENATIRWADDLEYLDPIWTWNGVTATAKFVNVKDSKKTQELLGVITSQEVVKPTCSKTGVTNYTATVFFNNQSYTNMKSVTTPANGHVWDTATYTWSKTSTGYSCTAKHVCRADSSHIETETVVAAYNVVKDPTCTEKGTGQYTARFTKEGFTQQIMNVEISIKPHSYTKQIVDNKYLKSPASCTQKAVYYTSCECGVFSTYASDTFESGDLLPHVYNQEVKDSRYIKTVGNCSTQKFIYFRSCECGAFEENNLNTFEGDFAEHNYDEGNICTECGFNRWSPYIAVNNCHAIIADKNKEKIIGAITIPEGVTLLSAYDIYGCPNITELYIPAYVTGLDEDSFMVETYAFYEKVLPKLENIYVDANNPSFSSENGVLFDKNKTILTLYPKNNSRTTYTVPDGVIAIGNGAFDYNSCLQTINVPKSVMSIGYGAFANCKNLENVYINSVKDSIGGSPWDASSSVIKWHNHIFNQEVVDFKFLKSEATCTNKAVYYKSCSCGEVSTTETFEYGTYASHNYGPATYTWSGDMCTAERACTGTNCISKETETVKAAYIIIEDSTCISTGTGRHTAIFEKSAFDQQTKETDISKKPHSYDQEVVDVKFLKSEATCTNKAVYYKSCSCGEASTTETFEYGDILDHEYNDFCVCTECGFNSKEKYLIIKQGVLTGLTQDIDGNLLIPDTVKEIGVDAFRDCNSLTSITIPNSVTSIGDYAFSGCIGLTSIAISDSVTSIGSGAFSRCTGLTSITIPESVRSMRSGVFDEWTSIQTIIINSGSPNGNYWNSWEGCEAKVIIDLGSEVTSIGSGAFYGCTGLTSITIPDSVTSIGDYAFDGCTGLTSITIPDSVTNIGNSAFLGCSGLTSVTIPDSVTTIGEHAFYDCSGLTNITIPDSVTSIEDFEFYGCSGLTSITIPDSVTSIGDFAFKGCSGLTSITIPDSVTSIGDYAFDDCTGLGISSISGKYLPGCSVEDGKVSITIPDSVTSIGSGAFSGCTGLTSITIPDSVTSIGSGAFSGCIGLTSIAIPDSVTSIGSSAFYGCTGLTSITIPDSVTSIGDFAFKGCSGLTSITIPDSVTSIEFGAFSGCTGLGISSISGKYLPGCSVEDGKVSITIPDSVTSIGYAAFGMCTGLTSITIPDSVTSICDYAFDDCTSLTSITIPNSVTSIGSGAFSGCTGLTSITIPDSVTSIGSSAFSRCTGLTSITIPDSVTSIEFGAFSSCTGLTSITISDSVTSIGDYVFYRCESLTSITIPDSVTSIGYSTFDGCTALKTILVKQKEGSISGSPWNAPCAITWSE